MNQTNSISPDTPFFISDWLVEPSLGRISRGEDMVKLEPKVVEVLLRLAQEPGEVVSREQLENDVWHGRIVGYDSLATTIIKLRKAFDDDSRNPAIIETVPKRGYRLIAHVSIADPGATVATAGIPRARSQRYQLMAVLFVVIAVLAMVPWRFDESASPPDVANVHANNKTSVAVLPFKNLSDDEKQDYFSDGMTADLITDLSQLSQLSVIARNSVFVYRNQDVDVRTVGKELGVQYVVEGSVRKIGRTVRISARLTDTANGYNLWAERFDGRLDDVFALQDRVAAEIVKSLELKLTEFEQAQLLHKYTKSVEAYDQFLKGWQYFWRLSKEGNQAARDAYLKAVALDKHFARAYANLALTYSYEHLNGWSTDTEETLRIANEYANKAVALDSTISQVYWALGVTQVYSRDYAEALKTAHKALELNPNYADSYGLLATVLNYSGKPEQALDAMAHAMRLNPRYPSIYQLMRGEMFFNAHRYDKAIDDFRRALEINPEAQEGRLWLAAALAYANETDDAEWQIDQVRVHDPELTLSRFEAAIPLKDPIQRKHLVDGISRAGMK
ncbi:MAG: winged helix-turn-helix domain-containing tetratricopeptide repeat protein [Gammaproteobacteria bacterium]|nr:winged helix-turn-helix domain-containing tetratricopeptide repeat protein [Gammaproteobacteria bacterium]